MTDPVILHKAQTDSTMEDARSAIARGAGHWTVCVADSQRAGRGRVPGRIWEDSGESLLFTLILDPGRVAGGYPPTQMVALALCRYLESRYSLRPSIKWPNDVLIEGRKIAGILVETEERYFLAGMGLNLNQKTFPDSLRRPAASLGTVLEEEGRPVVLDPHHELLPVLEQIEHLLDEPAGIDEVEKRLESLGGEVTVRLGDPSKNETLCGIVTGLQGDGALLIRTSEGAIHPIYSGEMTEKP